jgi:MFS family permease
MQKQMLPFKAFYFFIFAALAFLSPYLTLYYEGLGLTGRQIGFLAALPPLMIFVSAPFFGAIADLTQQHKRILGGSTLLLIASVILLSFAKTFLGLIPGVVLYAFFIAPLLPLIDRSVIEILGQERDHYGKQRLWGAVGWGLLAPVSGYVVGFWGLSWAFYGAAILLFGLFLVSQITPVQPVKLQVSYWRGVKDLLFDSQVIIFFLVILVAGMGLSTVHNYLFLYLSHLGAGTVTMGYALTVATLSELVIMYFADRLLKSWKAQGLILFGLVMVTIRLVGYALAPNPQVALLLQLLHGPTFAAIWMAGVAYVAEIAQPGLGNTAQGLFTGVVMGLGSALGAFLGGYLYQSLGFPRMYAIFGSVVFIAALVFWLRFRNNS